MITIQKHTHRQSVKNIPVKADDHNPTMNINSIPTRGIDRGKGTKPSGKWFRFGMVGYAISGSRYPIQINDHRSCCYLPRGTTPEAFPRGLKFHLPPGRSSFLLSPLGGINIYHNISSTTMQGMKQLGSWECGS